nr:uncharacterized protein LOC117686566 [Crassostrea gigas]
MSEFKFFNDRDSASESLITAEEVGLYLPLVLCIGTVLSVGFGPPVEANSVLLEVVFEHTVSAAALFSCLNLLQVFYPVASYEDDGSNPTSSASGSVEPDLPPFIDSSSQTEDRNFKVETLTMKQKYDREVRKLEKESRAIRRKYGKQTKDLRQKISSTDRELSSLQLQVPALENERSALLSEMDAVDKQLEEEQSRFDTLMSKFKTFHAQLIESGIASLMTVNFSGVESRQDEDIPDVLLNDYSALSSIQINAAES